MAAASPLAALLDKLPAVHKSGDRNTIHVGNAAAISGVSGSGSRMNFRKTFSSLSPSSYWMVYSPFAAASIVPLYHLGGYLLSAFSFLANMALTPERMARALEATDEDWHDLLMELARQQVAAQGPIAVPPPTRGGGDEF